MIIKLDIALINVSILLTVKEIAKKMIIIDSVVAFSFNNKEKKAKSGTTFDFSETAIRPVNPIINTTGIIIKNESIKLLRKTLLFFAHILFANYLDEKDS